MERILVTAEELAKLGNVTKRTVWRDVKRGLLPPPLAAALGSAHWHAAEASNRGWHGVRGGLWTKPGWLAGPGRDQEPQPLPETVTVEELAAMTDVSETVSCGDWWLSGAFPKPLPKPLRPRLWRTADVLAWCAEGEARQQAGKA